MKKRFSTIFGALTAGAALLAVTACSGGAEAAPSAAASTITVEHASGTTENVPVNPEKVFTFDLGVLDTMDALGVEPAGVPEAAYPKALEQYAADSYAKIGSLKEPDFEAVSEGAPDLIIVSGRTAGAYEELSKIAPTINLAIDEAKPMESFAEQTATLGRIFNKESEVEEKLAALNVTIDETKAKATDAGKGLIVLTSGGEVTAYGAGSRFGIIHDVLGVSPAAEVKKEGSHGEAVSFEYIKDVNPDILYVINRDTAIGSEATAADPILDNELVKSTNAAKNNKVISLDPASWYIVGYGLNNVQAMADAVADSLA
ncbi:siderophore ABC transporter substrate-binding protein [Pseudarthrobacter sp. J75]|uniref:siderophore ABC transporter substrate-binding protein n=1 Tax=unclassified Pseudarthrobacter TaxID=2647000 RepID=UPI002E81981B|nr:MULTISPECIES: siderophore ABC transporter substrate-binding protein [unclassified Pseudarthrobacter]MEE2523690.1 siderophore ABC transporter substrate-binding protein [Pseudarthrobacter sp. J47]MEE2530081.1 siderophore ABC transporter substrate-binding protein [Pseudarthrobacter sp. J75]MEE2570368.1 siderophore ABC transporter substrate-binding protein [Pseudarthrobacter sp. J64]